jgi:GT2 family glycosyltransferase
MQPSEPKTPAGTDPLPQELRDRLSSLERDVRDLHLALDRNITAVETIAAETRELRKWIESTSETTKAVTESRIWRLLTSFGGLLISVSNFHRPKAAPPKPQTRDLDAEYERWIGDFEASERTADRRRSAEFHFRPKISIVAAQRASDPDLPARTVESVLAQSYEGWELCVEPGGQDSAALRDPRIRVRNSGERTGTLKWGPVLDFVTGDYIAVLEPGSVLASDALLHVVDCLQTQPAPDIVYTDEDVMDESGRRRQVFFKPDWSPDLILSMNYVGGFLVFRRQLALEAGDSCASIPLASTYEMFLRLASRAAGIRHVPRVLCHRSPATSRQDADADRRAVDNHLQTACPGAFTEADPASGRWRVRYPVPKDARVSILIPSGGKTDLLDANLKDLASTDYEPFDILVIDNSRDLAVERLVNEHGKGKRAIRYLNWRNRPFNFAAICNAGAAQCNSPFLLFLNDDIRAAAPGWLQAMVELGARPEVGAVGARLLFPDGRIQHAGIALGLYGHSGHVFKGLEGDRGHYFGLDRAIRNVSAVTGACLLVKTDVFRQVGGFDEDHYPVDFNDVDLCLRIGAAGYRVLYSPYAELCHLESISKQFVHRIPARAEVERFQHAWSGAISNDPFYNPNLTRSDIDYSPRKKYE